MFSFYCFVTCYLLLNFVSLPELASISYEFGLKVVSPFSNLLLQNQPEAYPTFTRKMRANADISFTLN